MKKCYHCGISFEHDGDPIDENDFCGHVCSGDYIQNINRLHMATGIPHSRVANLHKNIMASFDKEDKEREELKELRRNIPDHHKYTDEEIRQIHRCSEHYKNLPLGMKADVYRLKPDPRVNEAEGYYDQHDENCDKEGCSECEEAEAGRAEYEAENAIANQRERYEADQEAIPKNWNGE